MKLWTRLLRKVLRVPQRLFEHLELQRKAQQCLLGAGAVLDPRCRIDNMGQRDALTIGERTTLLGECVVFAHGGEIHIGRECFIGEHARVWSAASIRIGDRVLLSHNVNVHDNNAHSLSAAERHEHVRAILTEGHPRMLQDVASAPIVIQDDAWIGFNATILKGVTIGKGAVVGAGSVVTKNVPDYAVVVGNPAREIGRSRA